MFENLKQLGQKLYYHMNLPTDQPGRYW